MPDATTAQAIDEMAEKLAAKKAAEIASDVAAYRKAVFAEAEGRKLSEKEIAALVGVLERLYLTSEDFAADAATARKLPQVKQNQVDAEANYDVAQEEYERLRQELPAEIEAVNLRRLRFEQLENTMRYRAQAKNVLSVFERKYKRLFAAGWQPRRQRVVGRVPVAGIGETQFREVLDDGTLGDVIYDNWSASPGRSRPQEPRAQLVEAEVGGNAAGLGAVSAGAAIAGQPAAVGSHDCRSVLPQRYNRAVPTRRQRGRPLSPVAAPRARRTR